MGVTIGTSNSGLERTGDAPTNRSQKPPAISWPPSDRSLAPHPGSPRRPRHSIHLQAPNIVLAEQYVFGDRMFQTNRGPSFPSHQYLISGTSVAAPTYSPLVIENNPTNDMDGPPGGCDSTPDTLVKLMDPSSGNEIESVYPCFDHPTLMDLLDAHNDSWRYYQPQTPPAPGLWTLDAIKHIVRGPDVAKISAPNTNVLADIAAGKLPNVSWVIPTDAESDHPEGGNLGPSWVASIVNAVGASPYWNSTAVIVTWDDWAAGTITYRPRRAMPTNSDSACL